ALDLHHGDHPGDRARVRRPDARLAAAVAARLRGGRDGRPGPVRAAARARPGAGAGPAGRRAGRGAGRRDRAARPRSRRHLGADVGSWRPFGWAWALPGDVARGAWAQAGLHLVLATALVAGLAVAWTHVLGRRLTEPGTGGSGSATVGRAAWVERLYPPDAAG